MYKYKYKNINVIYEYMEYNYYVKDFFLLGLFIGQITQTDQYITLLYSLTRTPRGQNDAISRDSLSLTDASTG